MRPGSFQEVLQRIRGMPHLAKQVGAVITTLSALAALALTSSQLWPDSAPPPTIGATFADVRLGERGVTMATVYRDYNLPTGGEEAWRLERPGIYIFYEIELVGLVGRSCTVRWTLLNGAGERVPGGQAWATVDAEAWPEFTWTAEAAEDRVTGRFWVPYAIPGTFHVEIALYDDRGTRLATYDTESFDARW
jgi:hypothetical protein